MGLTPTQFAAVIEKTAVDLPKVQLRGFLRKVGGQALAGVVNKTPVDTGRARGGWQVGINGAPEGDTGRLAEGKKGDAGGNPVIADGIGEMNKVPAFGAIHIANNVEYIGRLENGSSDQTPAGMLSVTLEEIANQFR